MALYVLRKYIYFVTASFAVLLAVCLPLFGLGVMRIHAESATEAAPQSKANEIRTTLVEGMRTHNMTDAHGIYFANTTRAQAFMLRSIAVEHAVSRQGSDFTIDEYIQSANEIVDSLSVIDIRSNVVHPCVVVMSDVRLGWLEGALSETVRHRISLLMIAVGLVSEGRSVEQIDAVISPENAEAYIGDDNVRSGFGFGKEEFVIPQVYRMNISDDYANFRSDIDESIDAGLIEGEVVEELFSKLGR